MSDRALFSIRRSSLPCDGMASSLTRNGVELEEPCMTHETDRSWWSTQDGQRRTYMHPVGNGAPVDRAMPIMVVRGRRDGPTFLTLAGVHGNEIEGIAAVQELFAGMDPESLAGTWVAVGCSNVDAYLAADRGGAADGQDMARVFPGCPDGTLTERVAHCLTEDFIRRASFLCDLHSAGRTYRMAPMTGYALASGDLTAVQREAARAFGLPLVWGTAPNEGRSLSAALALGVPAIYTETTGTGGCLREDVAAYVEGVRRVMIHLRMLEGEAHPPSGQRLVEDPTPESGNLQEHNVTPVSGRFRAAVDVNDCVREGDLLGDVVDLFGKVRFECRAEQCGAVLMIRHVPRVEAGDALAVVV